MRDPRIDPRPGDELEGPLAVMHITAITLNERGLESVRATLRGKTTVTSPTGKKFSSRSERTFSPESYRSFCARTEVIRNADVAAKRLSQEVLQ